MERKSSYLNTKTKTKKQKSFSIALQLHKYNSEGERLSGPKLLQYIQPPTLLVNYHSLVSLVSLVEDAAFMS